MKLSARRFLLVDALQLQEVDSAALATDHNSPNSSNSNSTSKRNSNSNNNNNTNNNNSNT